VAEPPVAEHPHDLHVADATYIAMLVDDDTPEPAVCRAAPGSEGRLLLGDEHMYVRVHAIAPEHVDIIVPSRPAAFDWQSWGRGVFEYVDDWGVCRVVGTAKLIAGDSSLGTRERMVRLGTTGTTQRLMRRRHMQIDTAAEVQVTDGETELQLTTAHVGASDLRMTTRIDLQAVTPVTFVLHLYRPVTGRALVSEDRLQLEQLDLDPRNRTRLELGIFGAGRR
jgi:hypothetical protein